MNLEDKIKKLTKISSQFETHEFLMFLAGILLQIPQRNENPFFKYLKSPLRQLFYLGFLNFQNSNQNKIGFSEEEWDEITILLDEIEFEYFHLLGFPKDGKETEEDIQKIQVTMPTFMNYFYNGPLSFLEQEIERIENVFKDFEINFINLWDLKISDFIEFHDLINLEFNTNLNKAITFIDKNKWSEFTSQCVSKGLIDPKDWINEAPEEIYGYVNYLRNPGSILLINLEKIDYAKISKIKFQKILDLFTFEKIENKEVVYYTDENSLLKKPFIKINEKEFFPFFLKQFLNSSYNFLFDTCLTINKDKILKSRDIFIENKTADIFRKFFGKEAFIYTNYSIDNNDSEQDILILFKNNVIVIEAKASSFRAPMRDVDKAYDKLKSDFKKSIQYGFEQTLRVCKRFNSNELIEIKNSKRQILYTLNPKRYRNIYSIIVTLDRFGHIQSNLNEMLEIEDDLEYPWAVNIDDLEGFILMLSKRSNKFQSFLKFLEFRQYYHGHLICGDELELCGIFLSNEKDFREWSLKEETIITTSEFAEIFDKEYYNNGLGFLDERFIEQKKDKFSQFLYNPK